MDNKQTNQPPPSDQQKSVDLGPFGNDAEVKQLIKYGLDIHNSRLPPKK